MKNFLHFSYFFFLLYSHHVHISINILCRHKLQSRIKLNWSIVSSRILAIPAIRINMNFIFIERKVIRQPSDFINIVLITSEWKYYDFLFPFRSYIPIHMFMVFFMGIHVSCKQLMLNIFLLCYKILLFFWFYK